MEYPCASSPFPRPGISDVRRVVAERNPSIPFGSPPGLHGPPLGMVQRFAFQLCSTEKLRKCLPPKLHGPTFMIDGKTLSLTAVRVCGFMIAHWSTTTQWPAWAWMTTTQLVLRSVVFSVGPIRQRCSIILLEVSLCACLVPVPNVFLSCSPFGAFSLFDPFVCHL